jgi:hypothetical protein
VLRTQLVAIAPARGERVIEGLSGSLEPAFLAFQAVENLPFPALLDPLDPQRRDMDRHSVLEPRAEESMHVRVCRAILSGRIAGSAVGKGRSTFFRRIFLGIAIYSPRAAPAPARGGKIVGL